MAINTNTLGSIKFRPGVQAFQRVNSPAAASSVGQTMNSPEAQGYIMSLLADLSALMSGVGVPQSPATNGLEAESRPAPQLNFNQALSGGKDNDNFVPRLNVRQAVSGGKDRDSVRPTFRQAGGNLVMNVQQALGLGK